MKACKVQILYCIICRINLYFRIWWKYRHCKIISVIFKVGVNSDIKGGVVTISNSEIGHLLPAVGVLESYCGTRCKKSIIRVGLPIFCMRSFGIPTQVVYDIRKL